MFNNKYISYNVLYISTCTNYYELIKMILTKRKKIAHFNDLISVVAKWEIHKNNLHPVLDRNRV